MKLNSIFRSCAIASSLAALSAAAFGSNLLVDPGFEAPNGGPGTPFTFTGVGEGGGSAAGGWEIYNFNNGTTTTWEETPPPGLSGTGNYSLEIQTTAIDDGVQQAYGAPSSTTQSVSGYVYVLSGSVGIGLEYEGSLTDYASTAVAGQWIFIGANTGLQTGIRTFDIFSLTPNSEFYVDNVDADTNALTPEPASLALLGLGAVGLLLRRRRASK